MLSGAEIQQRLRKFVTTWESYRGTERSEAQTFLNQLFDCYGSDRQQSGAEFEDSKTSQGVMDLHLPGLLIVEMKAPSKAAHLSDHRKQALDYWHNSADSASGRPAPPYVVLCAFHQFEVWEPGRYPKEPRQTFSLDQLPDRYEALLFLAGAGQLPLFGESDKALTSEAAEAMGKLYRALVERNAAAPENLQRFILQIVWCLFAEDLNMLEGHPVQRLVDQLIENSSLSSGALLGDLFDVLNDRDDYNRKGILAGTKYVNGSLFDRAAKVFLEPPELLLLRDAARFDWRNVDPTIFGSLMEGCLGKEQRRKLGAHYTHEADIMKIVGPTIVRPWRDRIDNATTPVEARAVLDELCRFKVLDPACGCGNFLYVAYRELRQLETEAKQKITHLVASTGMPRPEGGEPFYKLDNLHGIEIEPMTAFIARVTLWMGHKQMTDRFGPAEPVLPLVDMRSIEVGDALQKPWPATDCIIGNPPFLGSQRVRSVRGDVYIDWLKRTFNAGIKDYCVYWFRKAHDHLTPGQRAGLVGTNSISQNRARSESLEYIDRNGGVITDAVSSQKWPGEAKVHVSLVNWIKTVSPTGPRFLDAQIVSGITPELRTPERSTGRIAKLEANAGKCFQGPIPVGDGFIISAETAKSLLQFDSYSDVVCPYLNGEDIADDARGQARRWIIDFDSRTLEEAMCYPKALTIVRQFVKPIRDLNRDARFKALWWQFGRPRPALRLALRGKTRFAACASQGKRLLTTWQSNTTCPSNATNVFTFDDDYSMGILCSKAHEAWAWSRCSTLKADLRYTNTTVFETFAWPDPVADAHREAVADSCLKMTVRRSEICMSENIGLTTLYNRVDDGAYTDLKRLHLALDEAVAQAYGWPKAIAQDSDAIVAKLLNLNQEISSGTRAYSPFRAPTDEATLDFT